jgi:hypothetical protein
MKQNSKFNKFWTGQIFKIEHKIDFEQILKLGKKGKN